MPPLGLLFNSFSFKKIKMLNRLTIFKSFLIIDIFFQSVQGLKIYLDKARLVL